MVLYLSETEDRVKSVTEFAEKNNMLLPGSFILCAVSGGMDSMCLLHILHRLSSEIGFRLGAVHFNHMLRGDSADADAEFVRCYCERERIAAFFGAENVGDYAKNQRIGTEEAARILRYRFFEKIAAQVGADHVATAHNADDNAETVLMNLARGSGLKGLCGIPPVRGIYIRPLLEITRSEIETYVQSHDILHIEDETNADNIYTRNAIRHKVIPELKSLYPRFSQAAAMNAALLRQDEDYIGQAVQRAYAQTEAAENTIRIGTHELNAWHSSISSRVIRKIGDALGVSLSRVQTEGILKLAQSKSPSKRLILPKGIRVSREYSSLVFSALEEQASTFPSTALNADKWTQVPGLGMEFLLGFTIRYEKIHTSFNTFFFKKDKICGNIIVRPRMIGDKIKLNGRAGTKTIKKLLIEHKIPIKKRERIPLVCDESGVLAICGIGIGSDYAPVCGDETVFVAYREIDRNSDSDI
jgi:tRNA(Ile)-lysidine synthase